MHDAIYILKITLLQLQFRLPPQLRREVVALAEFVCLLYMPYFLQTPLPVAAPRLDRDFYVTWSNTGYCIIFINKCKFGANNIETIII